MSLIYIKNNNIYKYDETISKLDNLEINKNDIITSSLDISDVITYTLRLPKATPKEQIETEIELQFYENAGVDQNKQFKIVYILKEIENDDNYVVEVIAIDEEKLHKIYSNIIDKVSYIDFISFCAFSFEEFYKLYNKEAKRDAFVYLDKNQSFVAIYENGEYLYSKSLTSLSILLKHLSINYEEFVKIMADKGVIKENYEMEEFLTAGEIDKFFSDYFVAINNRVAYGKSVFYLDNIDNLYFYTPFKIKGLETFNEFWENLNVNFEIIPIEEINFLDKLSIIYNKNHLDDEKNLSIFPRPPKFYKTKTFQLLMVILGTILVFGGDFGYRYYKNSQLQNQINKLDKQISQAKQRLKQLKVENKKDLELLDKYNKQIAYIEKKERFITNVTQTSLKLINDEKLSKDLVIFSKLLEKNDLYAFEMKKDLNNTFEIGVYTNDSNRKNISVFMKDLALHNYYNVKTEQILFNKNRYISVIRFNK